MASLSRHNDAIVDDVTNDTSTRVIESKNHNDYASSDHTNNHNDDNDLEVDLDDDPWLRNRTAEQKRKHDEAEALDALLRRRDGN
jgi:hypothetical protein